jgi:hypothetical protein
VAEKDQVVDIASENANSVIGSYVSDAEITPARYIKLRFTISCDLLITGTVTDGGPFSTNAAGTSTAGNTAVEGTYTIPDGDALCGNGIFTGITDIDITINSGEGKTCIVAFDVANKLELFGDGTLAPAEPGIEVSFP